MLGVRSLLTYRRNIVPFLLIGRMLTLTSSTSLALLLQLRAVTPVHAAEAQTVVEPISIQSFLADTNAARAAAGIAPLQLNDELDQAALDKALDMKTVGYWDHFRPSDHKAPWDFINEAGYSYKVAGENLARGFQTANGITTAWLNSPAHRANLLSPKYTDVGFADIEGVDENGNPAILTVQMFGAR